MDLQEECLINMFATFQKHAENTETETDLWKQVKAIEEKLESFRATGFEISKNLKCLYKSEQFNATTKYVTLQGEHQDLCKKIEALETELKNFKITSTIDMENLTVEIETSIKQHEEKGKRSVKEIQEQIDKELSHHNAKAQDLYNELDLAQAAAALQQDEVETELCKELVDINVKIRQTQSINADVLAEINELKSRKQIIATERQNRGSNSRTFYATEEANIETDQTVSNNDDVIAFPDNVLAISAEAAKDNVQSNKTLENTVNKWSHKIFKNISQNNYNVTKKVQTAKDGNATKYQPLSVSSTKMGNEKAKPNKKKDIVFTEPNYGGAKNIRRDKRIIQPVQRNLEENMSMEGTNQNAPSDRPKRRKLFNPDNLDYLDHLKLSQT